MRLPTVLSVLVVVSIALVGAYSIDRNGHFEDVTVDAGASAEAKRNPLLACERMLTMIGLPTQSHRVVAELPDTNHVLLVVSDGSGIARTTRRGIVEWVNAGGHLVIALPSSARPIKPSPRDASEPDERTLPFESDFGFVAGTAEANQQDVQVLMFGATPVEVDFGTSPTLRTPRDDVTTFGASNTALHCISYAHGGGRVSVITSDVPLRNDAIGQRDHAEFIARVATQDSRTRAAWIVFGFDERMGFVRRLWLAAWPALIAFVALVALWSWRIGRRFGPVIATPLDDRRDFADHVRASGSFLTRRRAFATMIDAPRQALAATIRRRRPDLVGCDDAALHAELARIANLGVAAVHDALHEQPSELEFVRNVLTLERIRRSL